MDKRKILVLGANRYNFADRETGRTVEGAKIHFIDLTGPREKKPDEYGQIPSTQTVSYSEFDKFQQTPGIYNATVDIDFSGKYPKVKLINFEFERPINLYQGDRKGVTSGTSGSTN